MEDVKVLKTFSSWAKEAVTRAESFRALPMGLKRRWGLQKPNKRWANLTLYTGCGDFQFAFVGSYLESGLFSGIDCKSAPSGEYLLIQIGL
jgi:hypothetical protein